MAEPDSTGQGTFWDTGDPQKRCTRCGRVQALVEFSLRMRTSGRKTRQSWCKTCRVEVATEIKKKNYPAFLEWARTYSSKRYRRRKQEDPEGTRKTTRDSVIKSKYGLSPEEYEDLAVAQDRVCAICGQAETCQSRNGRVKNLAIDHDHCTGKVRALLCASCNTGLGYFKDRTDLLLAAIEYLRKHAS